MTTPLDTNSGKPLDCVGNTSGIGKHDYRENPEELSPEALTVTSEQTGYIMTENTTKSNSSLIDRLKSLYRNLMIDGFHDDAKAVSEAIAAMNIGGVGFTNFTSASENAGDDTIRKDLASGSAQPTSPVASSEISVVDEDTYDQAEDVFSAALTIAPDDELTAFRKGVEHYARYTPIKPVSGKEERENKTIEDGLKCEYEAGYDIGYKQGFDEGRKYVD